MVLESDGKKRQSASISDWEDIEIKPPIDLIPDEFLRDTNTNTLVELVCGEDDEEAEELTKVLKNLEYSVNKTDKDRQQIGKKPDPTWINNVLQKIEDNDYDGLLMIFAKVTYRNEDMKEIWSQFACQKCPRMKNKPKIFVFQIVKRSADSDSRQTATALNWMAAYETPAEADILIVHDKYDANDAPDLMNILAENIQKYGYREDIISLVSIGSGLYYHPMIISTMTKKFFFMLHEYRGNNHSLLEKHDLIKDHIHKIKELKAQSADRKLKKKSSFRKVFNYITNTKIDEGESSESSAKQESKSTAAVTKPKEKKATVEEDGKEKPSTIHNGSSNSSELEKNSQARRSIRKVSTASNTSLNSTSSKTGTTKKKPWYP